MGRIRNAYATKLRALLELVRPRRLELGVQLLLERADRLSARQRIPLAWALEQVYQRARQQIERRPTAGHACPAQAQSPSDGSAGPPPEFVCDAGLGGLARWLRAAGYEAHWRSDIDDDDLLREARRVPAILLTTDSLLMERGVLRDRFIPALWIPPTLTKLEQLLLVLRELRLPVLESRCMSCGGTLNAVDKESVRARIPPKTYRWRDEYFLCSRCDKLFWRGSHWERISRQLEQIQAGIPGVTAG
jgi:hypothetical protein